MQVADVTRKNSLPDDMLVVDVGGEEIIKINGQVVVMVRDTHGLEDNPFAFKEVKSRIENQLADYGARVKITLVPNITGIFYGRGVGYELREINLDDETKKISATNIRKQMGLKGQLQ